MIVGCPECSIKFLVNPEAIGVSGRSVKCAKCKHVWFLKLPEAEKVLLQKKINEQKGIEENKVSLSTIQEETKSTEIANFAEHTKSQKYILLFFKYTTYLVFIIALTLPLLVYNQEIRLSSKFIDNIYNSIGIYNTEGVALSNVLIQTDIDRFVIKGKVVNTLEKEIPFPMLKIEVLDGEKKVLASSKKSFEDRIMKPYETYNFTNKLVDLPENSEYLILHIGNKFEISLRDHANVNKK